jgi:ATP-dependent Lon protease
LPAKNERDLDDIPEAVREQLEIVLASEMPEVLAAVLEHEPSAPTKTSGGREVAAAQLH